MTWRQVRKVLVMPESHASSADERMPPACLGGGTNRRLSIARSISLRRLGPRFQTHRAIMSLTVRSCCISNLMRRCRRRSPRLDFNKPEGIITPNPSPASLARPLGPVRRKPGHPRRTWSPTQQASRGLFYFELLGAPIKEREMMTEQKDDNPDLRVYEDDIFGIARVEGLTGFMSGDHVGRYLWGVAECISEQEDRDSAKTCSIG